MPVPVLPYRTTPAAAADPAVPDSASSGEGNARYKANGRRTCRLDDFAPLVELAGTEFVSLQVGARAEELRESGWRGLIHDASGAVGSIEVTAVALPEVDLVITVDTMMAHLAGAIGRPLPVSGPWTAKLEDQSPRRS